MSLLSFLKRNPPSFEKAADHASLVHLIVDVQREFCDPTYIAKGRKKSRGTTHTEMVSKKIDDVSARLRRTNIPTIIVYYAFRAGEPIEIAGGGLHHLRQEESDLLARKHTNSGFRSGPLEDQLEVLDRKNILVSGFNSGFCISETVIDALDTNYNVWPILDCIGQDQNREKEMKTHFKEMKAEGARPIISSRVLNALEAA